MRSNGQPAVRPVSAVLLVADAGVHARGWVLPGCLLQPLNQPDVDQCFGCDAASTSLLLDPFVDIWLQGYTPPLAPDVKVSLMHLVPEVSETVLVGLRNPSLHRVRSIANFHRLVYTLVKPRELDGRTVLTYTAHTSAQSTRG